MKKLLLAGMLLSATLSANATTFYQQLCTFNFNWKKYPMVAPKGDARTFESDADYVQAHLSCVIPILKNNPTDALTAEQLVRKNNLITLLDGYREAKLFPLNHYRTERIPVFIDEHGTHCAVGYLMMMSGHEVLAQRISRTDNYVWVKDIKDPEALAWQQQSGFTMEELKLIQGAYDWYPPFAWTSPDKYETPQMPICTTAYFDETYGQPKQVRYSRFNPASLIVLNPTPVVTVTATPAKSVEQKEQVKEKEEKFVWCKGEGDGKTINGKWEQNYGPGLPWIKGFFINGKRSGDWEEYYPGTTTLCRTESWRNNKLNGVRKRFDRQSRLIEEIIFVEGVAVSKTNYDLNDSLVYVRIPQNDSIVATKVYNNQGQLIACGKEQIYNPSGLLWFQNIELTAMNSIQVSSRSTQIAAGNTNGASFGMNGGYSTGDNSGMTISSIFSGGGFQPALVEYHKIGTWWYYPETSPRFARQNNGPEWPLKYQHYGLVLNQQTAMFDAVQKNVQYDSLRIEYADDNIVKFHGYTPTGMQNFRFEYFTRAEYWGNPTELETNVTSPNVVHIYNPYAWWYPYEKPVLKSAGQLNDKGERLGMWYSYNTSGITTKKEEYLVPYKDQTIDEKKTALN